MKLSRVLLEAAAPTADFDAVAGPKRFTRMLLVTSDHLNKRDDQDFFEASSVPLPLFV